MNGIDVGSWSQLAVADIGATAALTGLLFVAVSINLARILQFPRLPWRAAGTLALLVALLAAGAFVLTPQPAVALGIELLIPAVALVVIQLMVLVWESRLVERTPGRYLVLPAVVLLVPAACLAATGVCLIAELEGGQYWYVAAFVTAIVGSTINAWVLLVEIQR